MKSICWKSSSSSCSKFQFFKSNVGLENIFFCCFFVHSQFCPLDHKNCSKPRFTFFRWNFGILEFFGRKSLQINNLARSNFSGCLFFKQNFLEFWNLVFTNLSKAIPKFQKAIPKFQLDSKRIGTNRLQTTLKCYITFLCHAFAWTRAVIDNWHQGRRVV